MIKMVKKQVKKESGVFNLGKMAFKKGIFKNHGIKLTEKDIVTLSKMINEYISR